MRGYTGVMNNVVSDLNGNGEKVHPADMSSHTLWQPHGHDAIKEPLYHLRVSVLKDSEGRGDCPARVFSFKSLHHLTHAANRLDAAFGGAFDIRKCGVETPDAMGGRVNDGRSENITIEFDSGTSPEGWKDFLARLKTLEDEWEHEQEISLL